MTETELVYAFTLGMVAAVNPCGFAMLPAYLSYFLGLEGATADTKAGVTRALAVALAVTGGFVVVFGVIGLAVTQLSLSMSVFPWITLAIGIGITALGIAMLGGYQVSVRLPKVQLGSSGREITSMFLFGVSYAVASLSCTLPLFLPVMVRAFDSNNLASGMASFLAYAAGMGLLLSVITVALSLAKGGFVRWLRSAQGHINRISGALLVIAGLYLTYYGYWEIRVLADADNPPPSGVVDRVTGLSNDIRNWLSNVGAERVAVVLVAAVAIAVTLTVGLRKPTPPAPDNP